ncbi:MAG: DNA polymerase I [Spirochaetota bacterium]
MSKTLYLVDGHGLIFRAYYAFIRRPLMTSRGENTSALFGFMRMLLRLVADHQPGHLVCVFDPPGRTFRYTLFPEYKAKRLKAPEDLLEQAELIREVLDALGLPRMEVEGYEADDVIGTLARSARSRGIRTVVLSSDKDILQLAGEDTTVYASKKGISEMEKMDPEAVRREWGVGPERIVDLLALTGDQSDNVPGVKGVGRTTAVRLIGELGSLEDIYENLERVQPERVRRMLAEGREQAFLSRELVTLRTDAPVELDMERFSLGSFPRREGMVLLAEKEMGTVVDDLAALAGEEPPRAARKVQVRGAYTVISDEAGWRELEKRIRSAGRCAVDTESTGTDPMTARLIGVSLAVEEGEGYYLPIQSEELSLGLDFLRERVGPLLEDPDVDKVGQNLKYDYVLLTRHGVELGGIAGDTMLAAYLLDPQKQRYSLDDLAKDLLDYETIRYSDLVKERGKTLLDCPLERVAEYAGEDADLSLRLAGVLEPRLEEQGLASLYREVEVPLVPVLGRMELHGVLIDRDYLGEMSGRFDRELQVVERDIHDMAEEEFNIRSTKQLGTVLFEKLGMPVVKRTKTGYSTDESVLEELARTHKIAAALLRHRKLAKLKSTYIDALPALINPLTGRIHTSFNQTITATGRLSSANPNLQNIPIREEEGKAIRRAFVPRPGWSLVSADYSQIELRILASLSGDRALMQAFQKGSDIHRETAALLFGLTPEQVQDQHRQVAKTINFSIIYGISPFGLSRRLGVPQGEAAQFITMYFQRYPGVKRYFDRLVEQTRSTGYARTLLGRRRVIPNINSQNRNLSDAARRVAINTPVQGTAADLIKTAMVSIDRELRKRGMASRMLIQVHDELVFEAPPEERGRLKELAREIMEGAIAFNVPITVNVSEGSNWEEAH